MPISVMAGVMAELEPTTLSLPGRDRRATMNAIYHPEVTPPLSVLYVAIDSTRGDRQPPSRFWCCSYRLP